MRRISDVRGGEIHSGRVKAIRCPVTDGDTRVVLPTNAAVYNVQCGRMVLRLRGVRNNMQRRTKDVRVINHKGGIGYNKLHDINIVALSSSVV